jgi:hypothetical protein
MYSPRLTFQILGALEYRGAQYERRVGESSSWIIAYPAPRVKAAQGRKAAP